MLFVFTVNNLDIKYVMTEIFCQQFSKKYVDICALFLCRQKEDKERNKYVGFITTEQIPENISL